MAIDAALGRLGIQQGVCTSSTRPTNPKEGQVIYETDTNRTLVYDNAAWLVVADNQVLSIDAANSRVGVNDITPSYPLDVTGDINTTTNLRIDGNAIGERVDFTPSWINFTPGDATEAWYYVRVKNFVFVYGRTILGSTSSFVSNPVRMSFPVGNATNVNATLGSWFFVEAGVQSVAGVAVQAFAGNFFLRPMRADGAYSTLDTGVSQNIPFQWASGDYLTGSYSYIIA